MLKTMIEASTVLKPARRNTFLGIFLEWVTFFFNNASITVIVKADSPNPLNCEDARRKDLKTMVPYGVNI